MTKDAIFARRWYGPRWTQEPVSGWAQWRSDDRSLGGFIALAVIGANHFEFDPGLRAASGGLRRDTVYPAGRCFDNSAIGNHFISVRGLRSDGTVKIIAPCENVVRVLASLHDEDDDIGVHLPARAQGDVNGGAYRLASSQRDARTRFSKQTQDRLRVLRIATFENIGRPFPDLYAARPR